MLDWYLAHRAAIGDWFQWGLATNLFQKLSALMCVIFAVGLYALGARYHAAQVRKEVGPKQFPRGYFTMLAIQLVPLTITGFVLHDAYIIGTRVGTLIVVLLVYGMVTSRDATFVAGRYRLWMTVWLAIAILGPMVWAESAIVRNFVRDHEKGIAAVAVLAMVAFVVRGQLVIAKELFRHFVDGNYTVKRFSLQAVRFLAFLFQSIHYWFNPTSAEKFLGLDPIFLQGALGVGGTFVVVAGAVVGFVRGSEARHRKRQQIDLPA
jgi:hypothetical protein